MPFHTVNPLVETRRDTVFLDDSPPSSPSPTNGGSFRSVSGPRAKDSTLRSVGNTTITLHMNPEYGDVDDPDDGA